MRALAQKKPTAVSETAAGSENSLAEIRTSTAGVAIVIRNPDSGGITGTDRYRNPVVIRSQRTDLQNHPNQEQCISTRHGSNISRLE